MATPTTSTAWAIPSHASEVQHLTQTTSPIPTPGPNQVLIKVTAASLNFRDLLISTHSPYYPGNHKHGLIPCTDGAGIIHSTHPSSSWSGKEGTLVVLHPNGWLTGDVRNLVAESTFGGSEVDGTLREWMVVDDEVVIPAPQNLSGVETSSLLTAGATAWAAIRDSIFEGRVWRGDWTEKRLEGQWVLTQGTGGVSCFAIQIAAALGATVIATSSSDEKLEAAKKLGAKHVINYVKTPDWDEEVLRITGGRGVDHVIEVGGAKTVMKSLNSARRNGLISIIGILTTADSIPAEFVPGVLFGAKIVKGVMAFSRDDSAEFVKFVEASGIKPVVASVFPYDQTVKAFETLQKQNAVGKLVVKISED